MCIFRVTFLEECEFVVPAFSREKTATFLFRWILMYYRVLLFCFLASQRRQLTLNQHATQLLRVAKGKGTGSCVHKAFVTTPGFHIQLIHRQTEQINFFIFASQPLANFLLFL